MEILVGCDPELFLRNSQGSIVSAHGIVPGTKHQPMLVPNGAIQVDGTALEFNIDPASTLKQFMGNIEDVLARLQYFVDFRNYRAEEGKLSLVFEPTADYDPLYFDTIPHNAKELGCEPDFDAYKDGMANPRPNASIPMRTASGHIHIGWTEDEDACSASHLSDCINVVKQMDAALYVLSFLWDQDERRRTLYGNVGAFRPKSYGVEYRTLSNKWLSDKRLQAWIYLAVKKAMDQLADHEKFYENPYCTEMVNKGNLSSLEAISAYAYYMSDQYGMPVIPKEYLRTGRK